MRGGLLILVAVVALGVWWRFGPEGGPRPVDERAAASDERSRSVDPESVARPNREPSAPVVPSKAATTATSVAAQTAATAVGPGQARFGGQVVDRVGRPVVGAEVTTEGPERDRIATTDAAGRFSFTVPAPATYRLSKVTADHFRPLGAPMVLTAVGGSAVDDMVIVLDRDPAPSPDTEPEDSGALPIVGRVVDDADQPVSGATVIARNPFDRTLRTTSGDEGRFSFGDISGRPTLFAQFGDRVSPTVTPSPGTTEVVLRLNQNGGFIVGRVSTPTGAGATHFRVWLTQPVGQLEERVLDQRGFAHPEGGLSLRSRAARPLPTSCGIDGDGGVGAEDGGGRAGRVGHRRPSAARGRSTQWHGGRLRFKRTARRRDGHGRSRVC